MSGQWWESDLIVGPFADIPAANAWAAANPSSLFPGLLATAGGVQVRWGGSAWVAASAPTINASTTGAITVQRGGVIKFGILTGGVTFALSSGSDEAHWIFTTGATPPTITWPTGITWSIAAPTISANKTYEISVLDNLALWISF